MAGKRVAIVQSCYIPWKGYFDLIRAVDEFILFDDAQYTKRDWRNRNQIKTPQGALWLTIPVEVKGRFTQKICDTVVSDPDWKAKHWKTLCRYYARAAHFRRYAEELERLYLDCSETHLSKINHRFLLAFCRILGIKTKLSWSMDYRLKDGKTERLIDLCNQTGATEYLSGPSAKGYLDEDRVREAGIRLIYMNYSGYKEYAQLFPPFVHHVSVIDLILNEGPNAPNYLLAPR